MFRTTKLSTFAGSYQHFALVTIQKLWRWKRLMIMLLLLSNYF